MTTPATSALYVGTVTHRRVRPKPHSLRYRVFWLLLDLDAIASLDRSLRWFSHNRFNLFSLFDRDYGNGDGTALRPMIEAELAGAGIALDGGRITLLTMPRVLGYVFNPLSLYFCHRCNGELAAIVYEVHNTFGERHSYLLEAAPGGDGVVRQTCEKQFHVSPFVDPQMRYDFTIAPPQAEVTASIGVSDAAGLLLATGLSGRRVSLTDRALVAAFATHPLLTLKVSAAILWEAARLWSKGIGVRRHPSKPARPTSVVRSPH